MAFVEEAEKTMDFLNELSVILDELMDLKLKTIRNPNIQPEQIVKKQKIRYENFVKNFYEQTTITNKVLKKFIIGAQKDAIICFKEFGKVVPEVKELTPRPF